MFQPIQAEEPVSSPSVGNEFSPALGIEPNLSPTTNLPLKSKQIDVVKGEQDIELKSQEIQGERGKANEAQEFQFLSTLPVGSPIKSSSGIQALGVKATPATNDIFTIESTTDPKDRTTRRVDNRKAFQTAQTLFGALDSVKKGTTKYYFEDLALRTEKSGFNIGPAKFGVKVLDPGQISKLTNTFGGDASKGRQGKVRKAIDAEGVVTSQLGQFARSLASEKGPLKEDDIERVNSLVPRIEDLPGSFERKDKLLKGIVLELSLEEAFRTKDFTTFNQAQQTYNKTFGKMYQPGSGNGFINEYNSLVNDDKNKIIGRDGMFLKGKTSFNEAVDTRPPEPAQAQQSSDPVIQDIDAILQQQGGG